jgi:catechol 2,3-dioxygenase-like lactoylglutathione lyase family enzyme
LSILGVDHVQLAAPAGSEQQARAFYGRLLGLEEIDKPEPLRARGGAWFRCGEQQLHIGIAGDFSPAIKAHPGLLVAAGQLETLAQRLEANGAEVDWDTSLDPLQRFYTHDPWGNRIELIEGPPSAPGDR